MARTKTIRLKTIRLKHENVQVYGGMPRPAWVMECTVNSKSVGVDHVVSHSDFSVADPAKNLSIINDLLITVLKEAEDLSQ